jgi:hypothetical protein
MITISAPDAPRLYQEALWKMRIMGVEEETRNGPVLSLQSPALIELHNPLKRLIIDPVRDANPFFHCMEFIWMMAGSQNAKWLAQFNKRYMEYSDDGETVHAAYGYRWRKHFIGDQIHVAAQLLERNPKDRRVIMQMWDADEDLASPSKDLPCNTQIMLRVVKEGELDMLVTNRSNDLIWGALGANIVHMTMLHELIASAAGLPLGRYRVVSNNLHMYTGMPKFKEIWDHEPETSMYDIRRNYMPLLRSEEKLGDFLTDCEELVEGGNETSFRTEWMEGVGAEMYELWFARKNGKPYDSKGIDCEHWRKACDSWLSRRSPTL